MRGPELPGSTVHTVRAIRCPSRLVVAAFGRARAVRRAVRGVGAVALAANRARTRRSRSPFARRGCRARGPVRLLLAREQTGTADRAGSAEGGGVAAQRLDARSCLADAQSSPRNRSVARRSAFVGRPAPRSR